MPCLFCLWLLSPFDARSDNPADPVQLELSPRICTMAADDKECRTQVRAVWHAGHAISVCLIVVDRPALKHCWEHVSEGSISLDVLASQDVAFRLEDAERRQVLFSDVMHVVRESVRYRHRRRQPWSLFE